MVLCIITTALSVALLALSAAGATIEATPKTLARVLERVEPGDTVLLADGVYAGDQMLTRSGERDAPITIRAAGRKAVFDGGETCLRLEGASWVVVEGIRFQNASVAGMKVRMGPYPWADHVTVRNCVFANNAVWGIITSHIDNFTVEGCEAFGATIEHGIYVANSGDDPLIRNNRIHHNAGNGIHINGDPSCGGDGVISKALVEGNVIWGNGKRGGSAVSVMHVQDSLFRNNLLYGNHAAGFVFYWYVGNEETQSSKRNKIINNTVYMRPGEGRSCLLMRNSATDNVVKNNIFVGGWRGTVYIEPSCLPGLQMDHNVIANYEGQRLLGEHSREVVRPVAEWHKAGFTPDVSDGTVTLSEDEWRRKGFDVHSSLGVMPSFANAGEGDFRLKGGSVGVDMGADVSDFAPADIDATPRPQGAAFDCGCYEAVKQEEPR